MANLNNILQCFVELFMQLDISKYYEIKSREYILKKNDLKFPEINSSNKHFDAMKIYMFCYELAKVLAKQIHIQENKILFVRNDIIADLIQKELFDKWPSLILLIEHIINEKDWQIVLINNIFFQLKVKYQDTQLQRGILNRICFPLVIFYGNKISF